MLNLSIELWARVASFAHRADLMSLALASSTHLTEARRIFCRSVRISGVHGGDIAPDQVFNYLVKYNMTSLVREIVVFAYGLGDNDRKTIMACPNLLSLTLVVSGKESILESAATQQRFVKELKESCPRLEEFRMNSNSHVRHHDFSIPNLKALKWKEHGKLSRALISLCEASLSTLTSISITVYDGLFPKFFLLRFPNLSIFRVGPGSEHFEVKNALPVGSALSGFLMAHPDIVHLELVYNTSTMLNWDTDYIPLCPKAMSPDILRKLQVLKAHPSQVCDLISAKARFFRTLKSLRLTSWDNDGLMMSKFLHYANTNGACSLNELIPRRNIFYKNSTMSFDSYIEKVAMVFPDLVCWHGDTPRPFDAAVVGKLLSLFPALRQIAVFDTDRQADVVTVGDVEILAINLPLLESVESCEAAATFYVSRSNETPKVSIASRPALRCKEKIDYHEDSDADNDCPDTDEYDSSNDFDGSDQEEGEEGDDASVEADEENKGEED